MNPPSYIPSGAALLAAAGVVGLIVGSFLNVVIHRLPRMIERRWREECADVTGNSSPGGETPYNLFVPRSACPHCGRPIRARDNIPVLSWFALGGRCRDCRARIGLRYPAVELVSGGIAVILAWRFDATPAFAGALLLSWTLIAAAAIDLEYMILPDSLSLPLLWAGLLFNLRGTYVSLESALIGAIAGYLVLWLVYHAFRLVTGKEGLGRGDFKLLGALGAWLGWQMLPLILIAASVAGLLAGGAWLLAARRGRDHPIPFGPFLAAAGFFALCAGPALVRSWLSWSASGL